jgi:signal transduction histidine kinase
MQLYIKEHEVCQNDISKKYTHIIFDSIERIKDLILEYLNTQTLDSSKKNWTVIDTIRLLSSIKENLYIQIESTNCTINIKRPLLPVFGNLTQIKQIFSNLIDNAIKYRSAEPPLVTISSIKKNNFVYFSVEDNGIGIPAKDKNTIFEKFKRSNIEYVASDTGIGLDICKKVVEQHGGNIEVKDNSKGGCTFIFSLPSPNLNEK